MRLLLCAAAALFGLPASAAEPAKCSIPGERIHWIVDYCMAKLETDDEIAAGDCIGDELDKAPRNACAAKRKYKRALCALSIERGHTRTGIAACLADPGFIGSTVRNGGVGR